jgi:hypothetical protein
MLPSAGKESVGLAMSEILTAMFCGCRHADIQAGRQTVRHAVSRWTDSAGTCGQVNSKAGRQRGRGEMDREIIGRCVLNTDHLLGLLTVSSIFYSSLYQTLIGVMNFCY